MVRKAWIDARHPMVNQRLWGLTLLERNLRELEILGIEEVVVVRADSEDPPTYFCHGMPKLLKIHFEDATSSDSFESLRAELVRSKELTLVLEGHALNDRRVLRNLIEAHAVCGVISPSGSKQAGAAVLSTSEASLFENSSSAKLSALLSEAIRNSKIRALSLSEFETYIASLRRKVEPYLLSVESTDQLKEADQILRHLSHKGVLEFVTHYIYAPLEFAATRLLACTPITPNQITILWVFLACLTVFLFATGHLLSGVVIAVVSGVLDGIDGKLARLTLRFSKFGDLLDHVTGTVYDGLAYLALGWYFSGGDLASTAARFTLVLFIAYSVERIVPGIFKKLHGAEIHDYAELDKVVRLLGSRMDNNIWLLMFGTVFGWPREAFYAICVWMVATAGWHTLRLFWVTLSTRAKKPVLTS
ncbi:MAG: CDP-alcohol phosphatidyltransferase family protein [bacterium]